MESNVPVGSGYSLYRRGWSGSGYLRASFGYLMHLLKNPTEEKEGSLVEVLGR